MYIIDTNGRLLYVYNKQSTVKSVANESLQNLQAGVLAFKGLR